MGIYPTPPLCTSYGYNNKPPTNYGANYNGSDHEWANYNRANYNGADNNGADYNGANYNNSLAKFEMGMSNSSISKICKDRNGHRRVPL
jgi:uncharacterized protein YjbI with pentapeptide repeats